jgi:UDP-N-acetyl-D-glucosamine/UDP-N-acetyl-D-galactosamine dehydrogenase
MKATEIVNNFKSDLGELTVIGLGYVGLPIAVSFSKVGRVNGFDISIKRVNELQQGFDRTGEVSYEELQSSGLNITTDPKVLSQSSIIIVTVPTPIDIDNKPDLSLLKKASATIGKYINKNSLVILESTVYPGVTEDICIPIMESESKLSLNTDFYVGYSPERISPADPNHTFININKVVSGSDENTLEAMGLLYSSVINATIHYAPSIKVAEASKVIENAQRDINVAFINELSLIFDKIGINTLDVLEASSTKWNFLNFRPGLVGGHCIGVDPYYLASKAREVGVEPNVILAGREVNNFMSEHIVNKIEHFANKNLAIDRLRIGVLGLTFKENCPDIRNSKVFDIIRQLKTNNHELLLFDPYAHSDDVELECGCIINQESELKELDGLIIAVSHSYFIQKDQDYFANMLKQKSDTFVFDVKSIMRNTNQWSTNTRIMSL